MVRVILGLALLCYPFLVYNLLGTVEPVYIVGIFGLLAAARLSMVPGLPKTAVIAAFSALLLFCIAALADRELTILKLYPVGINLIAAAFAGYTLLHPPSAIERLSRYMGLEVEGPAVTYTRRLTWVWMLFFLASAVAAAYTAVVTSTSIWAWYNGFVSYLLIVLLIVGEYPVRLWYQKRHRES